MEVTGLTGIFHDGVCASTILKLKDMFNVSWLQL